ncbi:peptidase [Hymenobacter sp. BT175]|uniref:M61 family metallopeptidase n=1 Tax=Hymenobacter translucens TaxID=2886507 RepID=UPI001D0E36DC|nr:peptidase [Hymenobacter translucens]MCC2545936.1 peptidase [Hymenobacter translucens]
MNGFLRLSLWAGLSLTTVPALAGPDLTYTVTIAPNQEDVFRVKLAVKGLSKQQGIYQFAATAPGTYQVMDMGRYVRKFEAFDKKGKLLPSKQLSTNQWQLDEPEKIREIRYDIAETWDTPVTEHDIMRMCGSSLEADHALLNGQTVLGYPQGLQAEPLKLKLEYPAGWKVGTVLVPDAKGYYQLKSYDHAVDSPILLGRLTEASTKVGDADVILYSYSQTDVVQAKPLLDQMQKMLGAAQAFLGGQLPVKRYAFLYHFQDRDNGAWEHSYSSEYVLKERPLTPEFVQEITDMAAHEFFHIVTPLNIHSEIIEHFNFVQPTGSEHLWLYEGVTEWASHTMQLRSGLIPLDKYLSTLHDKVLYDRTRADTTYSLSKLGLNSFSDEGQQQYGNIYQRGALTATLLDLRLLQLSGGKRGLRDVLIELTKKYGPDKPISEKTFFQDFTSLTYPEIGDFLRRYVQNAEPLPYQEYFGWVGIRYRPSVSTGRQVSLLGSGFAMPQNTLQLRRVGPELRACGVEEGDEPVSIMGQPVQPETLRQLFGTIMATAPGTEYELVVRRAGVEKKIKCRLVGQPEVYRFIFEPDPSATPAQLALRQAWLKNL